MSELVKRPGFAIVAEVFCYVFGGCFALGGVDAALGEGAPGGTIAEAVIFLLIGGGLIAMSVMMHKGKNWARVTVTALLGLWILCTFFAFLCDENIKHADACACCIVLVLVVCVIVFSWLPSVNKWFGSMNSRSKSWSSD